MATPAQQRANKALRERRLAEGLRPVTVWLSEAARVKLAALVAQHGDQSSAVEALLTTPTPTKAEVNTAAKTILKTMEPKLAPPKLEVPIGPQPFVSRLKKR